MPDMVHTVMPTDIYQRLPGRNQMLHRIARALATLRITVTARDLDPDMYLDIEPDAPATGTVRNILAVIHTVTHTPVRRRR